MNSPPLSHLDCLPRVEARPAPSSEEFQSIIAAETPVIMRGVFESWPALAAGRTSAARMNAYLKSMDGGALAPVMEAPAASGGWFFYTPDLREFNFSKRQCRIGDTLDRIERALEDPGAPFVAIQMLPLASHLPEFVRQNPMQLLPLQVTPRLWVGGRLRTQTHNDRDHNLACVLAGERRFLLFPPGQVSNLYIGPLDNPPPLSLVNPESPDFVRFPRFREALSEARIAELGPGDALFMPKYWWHHVTSLSAYNVMVNYWWGDDAKGLESAPDCLQIALLALKDLPDGEREYWKEMFDTYVFKAHGDPVAHLPPALQGALGPMNSNFRAKLKRQLKAAYLSP